MDFVPESPLRDYQDDNELVIADEQLRTIVCDFSSNYDMVFDLVRVSINVLPSSIREFVNGEGRYTHAYVSKDWYYQVPIWGSELQLVNSQTPEALRRNPESFLLNQVETLSDRYLDDTDYPFCFCTLSLEKVFWHRINTYPIPEGQVDDYDPDFDHSNWE